MHIVISGGTGLIGRYLSEHFRQKKSFCHRFDPIPKKFK